MDFHKIDSDAFTEEDAYRGHLRDIAVQNKHGLIYRKYYLNLAQKTAFCLMEGPDKKACIESHEEAHGIGACNVIEVSAEHEFLPYMGEGNQNEQDLALTLSGHIDSGYRTLLLVDCFDFSNKGKDWKTDVVKSIERANGSLVKLPTRNVMASFIDASNALECAVAIRSMLESSNGRLEFNLALSTGKPVDEFGEDLFQETKKRLNTLSRMASSSKILIDSDTKNSVEQDGHTASFNWSSITVFNAARFSELERLNEMLGANFSNSAYKSEHLGQEFGLSKTQFYRKTNSLLGFAPNKLLSEFRLKKALEALKMGGRTVAEIAYDSGFNSPTYFTRVFRKRFGALPTAIIKSGS